MNQRHHPRYPVDYAGSFLGEGITGSGTILNLSVAGCRVRSLSTIGRGQLLQMLIDVPQYKTPLQVRPAIVRWSNDQEFGLEFLWMPPDDEQRLLDLIRKTEKASKQS